MDKIDLFDINIDENIHFFIAIFLDTILISLHTHIKYISSYKSFHCCIFWVWKLLENIFCSLFFRVVARTQTNIVTRLANEQVVLE